jgi:hypothetical protein
MLCTSPADAAPPAAPKANQNQPPINQSTYFLLQLLCKLYDSLYWEFFVKDFYVGHFEVLAMPLADYLPPRIIILVRAHKSFAVCITPLECLILSPAVDIKRFASHPAALDHQFLQFILNHPLCHIRLLFCNPPNNLHHTKQANGSSMHTPAALLYSSLTIIQKFNPSVMVLPSSVQLDPSPANSNTCRPHHSLHAAARTAERMWHSTHSPSQLTPQHDPNTDTGSFRHGTAARDTPCLPEDRLLRYRPSAA